MSGTLVARTSNEHAPVLITIARASGSPPGMPGGEVLRMRMILVPENTTWRDRSGAISPPGRLMSWILGGSTGYLDTGTDSPVSIDSLTMASPDSMTKSAGKVSREASATSTTSPGTSESEMSSTTDGAWR